MSVFDALGAAAAITQFIGYGIKLGCKAVAAYNGRGQYDELESMTQQFQQANEHFMKDLQLRSSGPDSGEAVMIGIAEECQQASEELSELVSKVTMKGEEKSKWRAVKKTAIGEAKKQRILNKQADLEALRRRCHEQLGVMICNNQYTLADSLGRIERKQSTIESALARQLIELKKEVVATVKSTACYNSENLMHKLLAAQEIATRDLPRENILSSLMYSEMENRQSDIMNPAHSTYDWIFETQNTQHPGVRFVPWLENGDGIFWVTGKAGSGKSTLMKYICNDQRTFAALDRWSGDRKLLSASHYFWYLGSTMQKSYSGLAQSILYKILSSCPALIESVCSKRWQEELDGRDTSTSSWTNEDLELCLNELVTSNLQFEGKQTCFCFFIDGLDEYAGNHEIADAMIRLTQSKHTKICASSRPWNNFDLAFNSSKQQGDYLMLQLHTRGDIAKVVNGELRHTLDNLNMPEREWKSLVHEVVDRSEGVFLWVILVIRRELRPLLEERADTSVLLQGLNAVPSDLNEYFQQILDRIWSDLGNREQHKKETARIFKSCLAANRPLSIAAVKVIVDASPHNLAMSTRIDPCFAWDDEKLVERVRAQVNIRCKDLLAVVNPPKEGNTPRLYRVEFLHRSVQEFMNQSPSVLEDLDKIAGVEFETNTTLIACYIFLIKKGPAILNVHDSAGRSVLTAWSTEALLQLRSISYNSTTAGLLHELDRIMKCIFDGSSHNHWTNSVCGARHARDATGRNLAEKGERDLIGHLIELGLTSYVREAARANPSLLKAKQARPYLDYALRYDARAQFRSEVDESVLALYSGDPTMVELLLNHGCDPNQRIFIYRERTVWDLYLAFLFDNQIKGARHRDTTWMLIRNGARPVNACVVGKQEQETTDRYRDVTFRKTELPMRVILSGAFGELEAENMCQCIAQNEQAGGWWSWLTSWKY